jgi:SAM-dependent methyltransferase
MPISEQDRRNREHWDREADQYQQLHAQQLNVDEPVWGAWSIPEAELEMLGEVAGKDVLELGCGAAQWSIALAKRGARVVGLDNSGRQLEHARRLMTEAGVDFPLMHASAEAVPLPDESFDLVLSDHGALSWCDPHAAAPEAARLLRSGGLLVFNVASPLTVVCRDPETDQLDTQLHRSYFELHLIDEGDGAATYKLSDGDWIRLLGSNRLTVEAMLELRPHADALTTYEDFVPLDWARNWPGEHLWKARKA